MDHPPILEKNARHEGVNIIGSTAILNGYHVINATYLSNKSITSDEFKTHIEHILEIKKAVIFLDNAALHTSMRL